MSFSEMTDWELAERCRVGPLSGAATGVMSIDVSSDDEYSRGADRGQPCFSKSTLATSTFQWFLSVLFVF